MKNPKQRGAGLKALRRKKKLSLQDIYLKTRIRPEVLRNIEEGKALPSKVYLRSFVKAYARALDEDEEEILNEFFKKSAPASAAPSSPPVTSHPQNAPHKTAAAAAMILLAGCAALLYLFYSAQKEKPSSLLSKKGEEDAAPLSSAQSQSPERLPLSLQIEEGIFTNSLMIQSQKDTVMYFKTNGGKTVTKPLKKDTWHVIQSLGDIYIRVDGPSRLALAHKGRLSFFAFESGFEKTFHPPLQKEFSE